MVLFNAPFITRPGFKLRPMLVAQNDRDNARMTNTILVAITTNTRRSSEPTHVLIDISLPEGQRSGLLATSVVSCVNLITASQAQVVRKIGVLSPQLMKLVDAALKDSLALS